MNDLPLLRVRNLSKGFLSKSGIFKRRRITVYAVDGIDLDIYKGKTYALVGESGCGKSTLARLIMRLVEPTGGSISYRGKNLLSVSAKEMSAIRKSMQIIFQNPYASLDPRMSVREALAEPLKAHGLWNEDEESEKELLHLLGLVGLDEEVLDRYPHQFSGGQRQRICIARALALRPEFLVCDEPLSALDLSIQAQILNLLMELQERFGFTYLFITHDLSVVRHIADRVFVMLLGKIVEAGGAEEIFDSPHHPYTHLLLSAVPVLDPRARGRSRLLPVGEIPSPLEIPPGCRFQTRCPFVKDLCKVEEPLLDGNVHAVACHFPLNQKRRTASKRNE
ncbi:MAG: peptide/nickel transport system ATP-binding protein [Synergistaceae bacterium]|nr:peptide/nickel transport system ATP-binding protein [Synergistaceae bacterium]